MAHTINRPKPERLCILDPNSVGNDISGGTAAVDLIFERFSKAREEILDAMKSGRRSTLDWALGGNYSEFMWYRREMRKVYEAQHGEVLTSDEESVHQSTSS
jgi:hypothetical protein